MHNAQNQARTGPLSQRTARGNLVTDYLQFLWAFLGNPVQTGAIIPSQRFLISKMISPVPVDYRGQIVELGPGSGALTFKLAERCPHARILALEINPALARVIRLNLKTAGLSDRVEVVSDAAEHQLADLRRRNVRKPEFVISGIPLGNLDRQSVLALVKEINQTLAIGGMYIQFQYSLLGRKTIRANFHRLRTVPVLLNFPPAVIYFAQK